MQYERKIGIHYDIKYYAKYSSTMKKINLLILLLLIVSSCRVKSQSKGQVNFSHEVFETVCLSLADERCVVSEEMQLSKPHLIKYVDDGILVVADNEKRRLLIFLDTKTGKSISFLQKGEASNQMTRVDNIWVLSDTIFFMGNQDYKIGYCHCPNDLNLQPKIVQRFEEPIMRAISLDDHNFIYLPFEQGIRLKKGSLTNITDVYTEFPYSDNQDSGSLNNSLFQSYISFSPDRSNIVLATLTWNIIEVYNGDLKQRFIIKGPDEIDSNLAERNVGGMSVLMQTSPWNYYRGIACSNSQFMVGYIGVPLTDRESYQCGIRSILSFDWNGTPLKEYKLDKELDAFDIDFATMTLYGLVNTPYPHIVKYNLNK